jgi:hypothetical protein
MLRLLVGMEKATGLDLAYMIVILILVVGMVCILWESQRYLGEVEDYYTKQLEQCRGEAPLLPEWIIRGDINASGFQSQDTQRTSTGN